MNPPAGAQPATPTPWWDRLLRQWHLAEGSAGTPNRWMVQGLQLKPWEQAGAGGIAVGFDQLEVSGLAMVLADAQLAVGRVVLRDGQLRLGSADGGLRLAEATVGAAEVSDVMLSAPLGWLTSLETRRAAGSSATAAPGRAGGSAAMDWQLGPLAGLDGTVRARITDAQLLFDADVSIPIRTGTLDFNKATVAHVGPDSRMGISRMGVYVDAPNGRSYLLQFGTPPVAGVRYEERGKLLAAWMVDRGELVLQPFLEALLHQWGVGGAAGGGLTAQARSLLDRTALEGELALGQGRVQAPGLGADLVAGPAGAAALRLRSEAVGRELTATLLRLALRQLHLSVAGLMVQAATAEGEVTLRLGAGEGGARLELETPRLVAADLRVSPGGLLTGTGTGTGIAAPAASA